MAAALTGIGIDRLGKRLESEPTDEGSIGRYLDLFRARHDSPVELLALAHETTNGHASGCALLIGMERAVQQGLTVESWVDRWIPYQKLVQESWDLLARWDGLAETRAALPGLGTERLRALVNELLSKDPSFPFGCLVLHLVPDDAELLDRVVERLASWPFPSSEIAMGVSLLPPARWRGLLERAERLGAAGELVRIGVALGISRAAERGETTDPELDAALDVHRLKPDSDFLFAQSVAPVLLGALSHLSPDRVSAWLDRELDPSPLPPTFVRLLLVVPRGDASAVGRVLDCLAENKKAVRKPALEWLSALARDLGPEAAAHATRLPKGKLQKSFAAGLEAEPERAPSPAKSARPRKGAAKSKKSALVTKLERQLARVRDEGPTRAVYVLEAVPTPKEGAVSRVGGPGFALGPRHPDFEGLPMVHVFTLALSDVPDLKPAFGDASAIALYVSEPRSNEAWEPYTAETKVLTLDAGALEAGSAAESAGDLPLRGIRATRLEVPLGVFSDARAHRALRRALGSLPARAGGAPLWVQEDPEIEGFLVQLDARFAPLNLGDGGVMYVFRDTAFWQCA